MSPRLKLWIVPLAVLTPALIVVLLFAKPAAPRRLELYAGPEGSTYYSYAQRYADFLGERGITVQIVETAGSIESLRSLASVEKPAAAFALSGVDKALDPTDDIQILESLGCLSFQPFWLFVRAGSGVRVPGDLAGLEVALGPSGHDARALATTVLVGNGVEDKIVEPSLSKQTPEVVANALIRGDLDAAFFVGKPHSPAISILLESDAVEAVSFRRVAAYSRLHPGLGKVVVPEGIYDLSRNIPDTDLDLMSPADNLVVRSDLHPAAVDLLLDAARSIHREPTMFAERGTFPNIRHVSLPLNDAAVRFYEDGPSPWRKILPYWLATFLSRFALILAQVGAVVWFLLKGIPALLRMRFKMKVLGFYKRMENLEQDLTAGASWDESVAALREIYDETSSLEASRFLLSDYLELRQNVHDLRERIEVWHQDHPSPD